MEKNSIQQNVPQKKEIVKVTSGTVKAKKKSTGEKIIETFLPGDIKDVRDSLVKEVLIPALKRTIYDFFTEGLNGLLYPGQARRTNRGVGGVRVDYGASWRNSSIEEDRPKAQNRWERDFDFEQISFSTRADAEAVLAAMAGMIETYKWVSVAEFYDLAGVTSENYQLNKYGWKSIRNADILKDFRTGEYYIHFPRPMPIDN